MPSRTAHPLPTPLLTLASRQGGLLGIGQCRRHGVSTGRVRHLVAAGAWQRVGHGVYLTDPRPAGPDIVRTRTVWRGLLTHPEATAVGVSALVLHMVAGVPLHEPAHISLPDRRYLASPPGVRVRRFRADPVLVTRDGARTVRAADALAQAVPELERETAVALMDSALNRRVLTPALFAEARESAAGRRGATRSSPWWALADERAQSPLETRARLDCLDHGVPPDTLQLPVRDHRGRLLGRGDLAWRLRDGRWLVAEIDGAEFHDTPDAVFRDRLRQNGFLSEGGVDMLRFSWRDVARRGTVPTAVARHLANHR